MVAEARLEELGSGLAPVTAGWFIVNATDAAWATHPFGDACFFEGEQVPFDQIGINLRVIWPATSTYIYHAESAQEDFLVRDGKGLLLVLVVAAVISVRVEGVMAAGANLVGDGGSQPVSDRVERGGASRVGASGGVLLAAAS